MNDKILTTCRTSGSKRLFSGIPEIESVCGAYVCRHDLARLSGTAYALQRRPSIPSHVAQAVANNS